MKRKVYNVVLRVWVGSNKPIKVVHYIPTRSRQYAIKHAEEMTIRAYGRNGRKVRCELQEVS